MKVDANMVDADTSKQVSPMNPHVSEITPQVSGIANSASKVQPLEPQILEIQVSKVQNLEPQVWNIKNFGGPCFKSSCFKYPCFKAMFHILQQGCNESTLSFKTPN